MIDVLNDAGVPLFRTPLSSKAFTTEVTVLLEESLQPEPVFTELYLKYAGWEH